MYSDSEQYNNKQILIYALLITIYHFENRLF